MSLSLSQLDDLIDALHVNAGELVSEAGVLLEKKAFARAHALAHIAREEISKSLMLEAAAFKVLAGAPIDWKKLMRRFRNHEEKLKLENVMNATFMSALADGGKAVEMIQMTGAMAKYRNDRKNRALYVDWNEGTLSLPKAQFDEYQAWRTWQLADIALKHHGALRMKLGRFDAMDKEKFVSLHYESVEEMLQLDPAELLRRLGAAQAALLKREMSADEG